MQAVINQRPEASMRRFRPIVVGVLSTLLLSACVVIKRDPGKPVEVFFPGFSESKTSPQAQKEAYRLALEGDDLARFQTLVQQGLGPNVVMPDGNPAVQYGMQQGARQIVTWLLQHPQLDVQQKNMAGDTAVMQASAQGELAWVTALAKRGGDLNPATGWTPLHYAAGNGHLSVVEYLLSRQVRIDAFSPNRTTPLMMAARANSLEAVRLLVARGARVDLENEAGFSALSYAQRNNNTEMAELIKRATKPKR